MKKTEQLKQCNQALQRLEEALHIPRENPLAIDGTIQRFEFTFELTWKTLKTFLEDYGIQCYSPRNCLQEAFKMGWVESEEAWLEILQARNMTSHVYNEEMASEIYDQIKEHGSCFHRLIAKLKEY